MFKILLILLMTLQYAFADTGSLTGKWYTATRSLNQGTEIIEKEYLTLQPNGHLDLILLVSVKKGNAYIKDLRMEVTGKWQAQYGVLVYQINDINIPRAKAVYLISQKSLEDLAHTFKQRYVNHTMHINKIESLDEKHLVLINSRGNKTSYKR